MSLFSNKKMGLCLYINGSMTPQTSYFSPNLIRSLILPDYNTTKYNEGTNSEHRHSLRFKCSLKTSNYNCIRVLKWYLPFNLLPSEWLNKPHQNWFRSYFLFLTKKIVLSFFILNQKNCHYTRPARPDKNNKSMVLLLF